MERTLDSLDGPCWRNSFFEIASHLTSIYTSVTTTIYAPRRLKNQQKKQLA